MAIQLIQQAVVENVASATYSLYLPQNQRQGDLIVVVISIFNDSTHTISSVSDSIGNSYQVGCAYSLQSTTVAQAIYYANNVKFAPGYANKVSVVFTGQPTKATVFLETYSGCDVSAAPTDGTNSATGNGSNPTSGWITTSNPGDLVIGAVSVPTLAVALVQSVDLNSLTPQFTASNTTTGNAVVVMSASLAAITNISIQGGGTFSKIKSSNYSSLYVDIWICPNIIGATKPVTVTVTGPTTPEIAIYEFKGLNQSLTVDGTNSGGATGTALSTGQITTTQPGDLVLKAFCLSGTPNGVVETGWTEYNPSYNGNILGWIIQASAGAITGTDTQTSATYSGAIGAVASGTSVQSGQGWIQNSISPANKALCQTNTQNVRGTYNSTAQTSIGDWVSQIIAFKAYTPMPNPIIHGQTHLTYPQTDFPVAGTRAGADPCPLSDIWNVRTRSFNAIGNPNFEVDQRTVGVGTTTTATFAQDRWMLNFSGSGLTAKAIQMAPNSPVLLPGTNFPLSQNFLRVTLTGQDVSPAAGDYLFLSQFIEGIRLRELLSDYHSFSIIVRSNVAGAVFGIALRDTAHANSLLNIGTIANTNQWTICQLPALPIWTPSATWSTLPGIEGYELDIILMAGSTFQGASSSLWQSGNFLALPSCGNFAANPIGSTFDIAFVQHEPGAYCTMPMDISFAQNLIDSCRYFCKSYNYTVAAGSVSHLGVLRTWVPVSNSPIGIVPFPARMAKTPTSLLGYSDNSGAVNNVYDNGSSGDRAISSILNLGETAYAGFLISTTNGSQTNMSWHHTADTGW